MKKTVKLPPKPAEWQENFKRFAMRSSFVLTLSRPMMEMLCAVSDGVQWDRRIYRSLHLPDSWIATIQALAKRGLIIPKSEKEREAMKHRPIANDADLYEWHTWNLTPAGKAVIELMKSTGLFVACDVAENKRARKA